MLSPFDIEKMSQSLQVIYQEIESELLKNIASRFSSQDEVTPNTVSAWQLKKLSELGGLNQDNIKFIAQYSKRTESEITKIFTEAGYKCLEYDESIYKKAFEKGLLKTAASPLKASSSIQQIISSAIGHAKKSFNLVNTTALQSASQSFMDIINRTYLETSLGVRSYTDSIRTAVRELADKGITGITYKRENGQIINYPVDAAVRRNIITSTSQTAGEIQLKRAEEWGSNLVEVSSHMGARPSHAVWQGKIFYRKGHPVEGYKEFEATTGYGTVEGLKGINCSHDFYPFFEGLSEQTYFPYNEDENAKAYEESQQQRKLERDIRQQKRRILSADEIGDEDGKLLAQLKLKNKENELNDFLNKTGRTQRQNRQQVMGFGRSQASQATWVNKNIAKEANSLYNLGNEQANVKAFLRDKPVRDLIKSSDTVKTLEPGQFRKHVPGTLEYNQYVMRLQKAGQYGPSRLSIDVSEAQRLVDLYHGTGNISRAESGAWRHEEIITTHSNVIGIVVNNLTGKELETTVFKIKYGPRGTHIVPDYPSKRGKKQEK